MSSVAKLLGCRYPVIQGAMGVISNPEMVAAVSEAGGLGLLATAFAAEPDIVRGQIRGVKKLTDKPFGANLHLMNPLTPKFAELLVAEGLPAVTLSGGSPKQITPVLQDWKVQDGICHLYVQHTSASLIISESYDPSARLDLEAFLERLVPEGEAWHRHTVEGRDDSSSHMRSILTATTLSIPVDDGSLSLGTWQGIYLFEHRIRSHRRSVLIRCLKVS